MFVPCKKIIFRAKLHVIIAMDMFGRGNADVSHTFFSRDFALFSRDFEYVHWNILTSSPIRIFIFGRRYVPILKTFLRFFLNWSFGGVEPPEGLEIAPDILTQIFLKIRILTATGASSEQPCSAVHTAQPSQNGRIFSRIVKAGERTCSGAAGEVS
jgi:hypothetical protein